MLVRLRITIAAIAILVPSGCNQPFDASVLREPSACADQGRKACEAACARDDEAACLTASVGYTNKPKRMMELELRACELGSPQGCDFYANNFKGSDSDAAKARDYTDRACSLGWGRACAWLASSYLRSPSDDPFEVEDAEAARSAWESGCAAEATYCGGLGDFEALGLGGRRDDAQARAHWTEACDAENEMACLNLRDDDDRVWLQGWNRGLIHTVKFERLNLELQGAMPGQEFNLVAGACFRTGGNYSPVHTTVVESSNIPQLDQAVELNLAGWRARPKAIVPSNRAACFAISHFIKQDGHIHAKASI